MKFLLALNATERRMLVNALACKIENMLQHAAEAGLETSIDDWVKLITKLAQLEEQRKKPPIIRKSYDNIRYNRTKIQTTDNA